MISKLGKLSSLLNSLPPNCLKEPHGDPIELFFPDQSPGLKRKYDSPIPDYWILNLEAKNPAFNVNQKTNLTQMYNNQR